MYASKMLANDDISKATLTGDKTHTGLLKLLEFKHTFLKHFINVELPKHGFPEQDRELIRAHTATHALYAKMVAASTGDTTWTGSLANSSTEALRFLEERTSLGTGSHVRPGTCHLAGTGGASVASRNLPFGRNWIGGWCRHARMLKVAIVRFFDTCCTHADCSVPELATWQELDTWRAPADAFRSGCTTVRARVR